MPANDWVKDIQRNGVEYEMADQGMGFLGGKLKGEPADPEINGNGPNDDDDEGGEESTQIVTGGGRVINQMPLEIEGKLYRDLHEAYGGTTAEEALVLALLAGCLAAGFVVTDLVAQIGSWVVATVALMGYIKLKR